MLRRRTQYESESLLAFGAGSWRGLDGEKIFCFAYEASPVGQFKVCKGTACSGGMVIREVGNGDREMVRI